MKDRAALGIVRDAEDKGRYVYSRTISCRSLKKNAYSLKPGGTVIEGTAGNTGIGLAHVCRARGYKCVIYMPNTQASSPSRTLSSILMVDTNLRVRRRSIFSGCLVQTCDRSLLCRTRIRKTITIKHAIIPK